MAEYKKDKFDAEIEAYLTSLFEELRETSLGFKGGIVSGLETIATIQYALEGHETTINKLKQIRNLEMDILESLSG